METRQFNLTSLTHSISFWFISILVLAGCQVEPNQQQNYSGLYAVSGSQEINVQESFTTSDGGKRACRIGHVPISDFLGCGAILTVWQATVPVIGSSNIFPPITQAYPASNTVEAAFSNIIGLSVPQISLPHYGTAAIYKDIVVPEHNAPSLTTQVSVQYGWEGGIAGTLNYEGRFTVALEVEDITDSANPIAMGTLELVERDRSGDQGFTDIALGGATYHHPDESASYLFILLPGHIYRLWFKAEAYGAPTLSLIEASVRAWWKEITVTYAYGDNTELLALAAAAEARLIELDEYYKGKLDEIIVLLNTPQGQRPDFPITGNDD